MEQQTSRHPAADDRAWMERALREAARGPLADPNPRVGAVVLDASGRLAGVGHHAGAGTPHAEAAALAAAGARARGGTVFVTLEPCAHTGRTPPCAEALVAAAVARVVHGASDPSPWAAGGASRLREAGVVVESGLLAAECEALNPGWTHAARHGRPRVIWKVAATLDGRVAAADGSSQWITSPEARADGHRLRAACGAVLVGTGTALADDPSLTARAPDGALLDRQPLRVVAGRRELPAGARLRDGAVPPLQLASHDPADVLRALHERQVRQVLLEGGPTLGAAFWRAGLVDELVAYLAPALLGAGPAAVGDLGISTITDIARLELVDVERVGPDIRLTGRPRADPAATRAASPATRAATSAATETTTPTPTHEGA